MLKQHPRWARRLAKILTEGETYRSHGKVIDFNEAKNVLRLNVELIDNSTDLWEKPWELYIRSLQFLNVTSQAKLFENEKVSVALKVGVRQAQIKPPTKGSTPHHNNKIIK